MSFFADFWSTIETEGFTESEPESLFRTSLAINGIPIHHEYENMLIQSFDWDEDYLKELRYPLEAKLIQLVEDYLGYKEEEFWFGYVIGYEPPTEIGAFDAKLSGTWKFQIEKNGRIVFLRHGYNKNL